LLRATKGEVVLVSRLRAALGRLNLALPEAITAALDELTRDLSPRTARTAASARSRRIGNRSSSGSASSGRTSRAACRWR
jgi:hypothetical protein